LELLIIIIYFEILDSQPDAKKMATSNDRKLLLLFVKNMCTDIISVTYLQSSCCIVIVSVLKHDHFKINVS